MRKLLIGLCLIGLLSAMGCTSHSWTKIDRNYQVSYSEVFDTVPEVSKKCSMSLKEKSSPESGLIVLNCRRIVDQILTGSLLNLIFGDEVIVKVKRVDPAVTNVWIDSKAHGQIGPDFGRTDRNVTTLAKQLDKIWAVVETDEEIGEKRKVSKK